MARIHWSNAVDGDFDDAGNWSARAVPGRNDHAVLGADGGAAYTVTASANETLGRLSIARGDTLAITDGVFTVRRGVELAKRSTIAVSGGSTLRLKGSNSGYSDSFDEAAISVDNGSKAILKSADVVQCLLKSASSGKFVIKGQCYVYTEITGTITVKAGAALSGYFDLRFVTHLAKAGGAELRVGVSSNAGTVTLHEGDGIVGYVSEPNPFLRNERTGVIAGAGQIGQGDIPGGTFLLLNDGVIDAWGRGLLTIDTGGKVIVNNGTLEATDRGRGEIVSEVRNDGVLKAAGGSLRVDRRVVGAGSGVVDGGTLAFGSTFSQDVAFTGASGVLKLGRSQGYAGAISGFSKTGGTSLDLRDIGFTGAGEATFDGDHASGVLTVSDGTHTAHITLIGDYTGVTFVASGDGHGGVSVTDTHAPTTGPAHALVAAMAAMPAAGASAAVAKYSHVQPWLPMLAAAGHARFA